MNIYNQDCAVPFFKFNPADAAATAASAAVAEAAAGALGAVALADAAADGGGPCVRRRNARHRAPSPPRGSVRPPSHRPSSRRRSRCHRGTPTRRRARPSWNQNSTNPIVLKTSYSEHPILQILPFQITTSTILNKKYKKRTILNCPLNKMR